VNNFVWRIYICRTYIFMELMFSNVKPITSSLLCNSEQELLITDRLLGKAIIQSDTFLEERSRILVNILCSLTASDKILETICIIKYSIKYISRQLWHKVREKYMLWTNSVMQIQRRPYMSKRVLINNIYTYLFKKQC